MGRLTDIGLRLGTDKAEHHEFTEFYENYFEPYLAPKILEIGILDGASLKMYHEFFNGKATIIGVDMNDKSSYFPNHPTIKAISGDILLSSTVERIKKSVPNGKYDIIIDDGGHKMEEQQKALLNLWDSLEEGGIFIIEDLHTSGMMEFNPDRTTTTLSMLQGLQNNQVVDSKYITVAELEKINSEIKDILIWDNSLPQQGPRAGRSSITSIIIKKVKEKEIAPAPVAETKTAETTDQKITDVEVKGGIVSNPNNESAQKELSGLNTNEKKSVESPVTLGEEKKEEVKNEVVLTPEHLQPSTRKKVLDEFFEFVKQSPKHIKLINMASLDDAMNEFNSKQK